MLPEVCLGELFVIHMPRPFREPVISSGEQGEERARHQHVVEVRDNVVGILYLDIDGTIRRRAG